MYRGSPNNAILGGMPKAYAKSDLKAPVYSDTKNGLNSCKTLVILDSHFLGSSIVQC